MAEEGNYEPLNNAPTREVDDHVVSIKQDSVKEKIESQIAQIEGYSSGWFGCLVNPWYGLSVQLFFITGCFGVVCFCLYQVHSMFANMDLIVGIVLVVIGFLAAFELKTMGQLTQQISHLNKVIKGLKEHVKHIADIIDAFGVQLKGFSTHITGLGRETGELYNATADLTKKKDNLKETQAGLTITTNALKNNIANLEKENNLLEEQTLELETSLQGLDENVNKFEDIKNELKSVLNEDNSDASVHAYLGKINGVYDRINYLVKREQKLILQQSALRLEFRDGKEGLTETEFNRYIKTIPGHYAKTAVKMGVQFEDYSENGRPITTKALNRLIDELIQNDVQNQTN